MSEPNAGTTPQPEPGNGQAGQAQQTQQAPTQTTPQQQQTQPSVEELQQRIAEQQKALEVATNSARHYQSLADRTAAQIKALAGAEPKSDPFAEDVAYFTKAGYAEQDARVMVEFLNRKLTPVTQELNTARASLNATTRVQSAIETAANKLPAHIMQDPEVYQATVQGLQQAALAGESDYVTPEYAQQVALLAWANKQIAQPNGAKPPQQQPPGRISFFGAQGGYTPAMNQPQTAPPRPPGAEAADAEIAQRFGFSQR